MNVTDAVVIGAGHAGLAVSHLLTGLGREHVVLERGRAAERWRSERWDSLRLLTPNWLSRLPGWSYAGTDPEGYMSASEVADYLVAYGESFCTPLVTGTTVLAVDRLGDGYRVVTDRGVWQAADVIIATGHGDRPAVPDFATQLSADIRQTTAPGYRNPQDLPDGGVLVVGASSSGVQIADELRRAGRPVFLAAGRHTRVPRRYRGMDIHWWLDRLGLLDKSISEVTDLERARHEPSLQLVGRKSGEDLDLRTLQTRGVVLTGRLRATKGTSTRFAGDLTENVLAAENRMRRVLAEIDEYVEHAGLADEVSPAGRVPAVLPARSPRRLDLRAEGVTNVVWATGYRSDYRWLRVPVVRPDGELIHDRGVTASPGLYAVGLPFQSRRSSSFLDGARHDARLVTDHIARRHGLTVRDRPQLIGSPT